MGRRLGVCFWIVFIAAFIGGRLVPDAGAQLTCDSMNVNGTGKFGGDCDERGPQPGFGKTCDCVVQIDTTRREVTDRTALFQEALQRDGFDVHVNLPSLIYADQVSRYCAGSSENAEFGNAASPYLLVRPWRFPEEPPGENTLETIASFQLWPDEAIVLIGLTPPAAKYFSFQPYVYRPAGAPKRVFAALGDTVNVGTIKTLGNSPFNSLTVLIFTPDQGTDARVRAALQRAGYPAAIIHTLVFPASELHLGIGPAVDRLTIMARVARGQDNKALQEYLSTPPLSAFRVTPRTPAALNPFPAPRLRVRGTGQTEMGLMNKLGQLRHAILAANAGLHATLYGVHPGIGCEAGECIQRLIDPIGDNRDAFYETAGNIPELGSSDPLTLAEDEFLIAYGVNHVATGKATYMNMNFYAHEKGLVLGMVNDDQFPDTATPYLPGDPAADLMYAYKVSRNCGGQSNCLELSSPCSNRLPLNTTTELGALYRTYLEPATKVGPTTVELLLDRIIKFSPRP